MHKVRRRQFLFAAGALLAAPQIALAQARTARIGFLGPRQKSVLTPAVLKRLGELGFVEGKNLIVENRSADGVVERFPSLARELIQLKCDLILAVGTEYAARALRDAKTTIPVVILANDYDPVAAEIVSNLRRPGGNVTGVYVPEAGMAVKRLELMREIVPKAKRFLVLADRFSKNSLESVRKAADKMHVEINAETFTTVPYDFESAFARGRAAGIEVVIVLSSPVFLDHRKTIAELALKHRQASAGFSLMAEAGLLLSYSAKFEKAFSRAGDIAASILGGAKPGDIPVEQATEFELAINMKTARTLGIAFPQSIAVRADLVIE
jgi:putative ABC transport system substrate-binding protein